MGTSQFCTFSIEGQLFGVKVSEVQEILRHQPTTVVPLAPKAVAGLMNIRGQIVPIVDLRRCLELEPRASDAEPPNVVLTTAAGAISLLVDEIGDVLEVDDNAFELPPDNLRENTRKLLRGVYK